MMSRVEHVTCLDWMRNACAKPGETPCRSPMHKQDCNTNIKTNLKQMAALCKFAVGLFEHVSNSSGAVKEVFFPPRLGI